MPFPKTYRQSAERIGRLREIVEVFTPVSTPTAHRGEKIKWVSWVETRGMVQDGGSPNAEAVQAERLTALNTKTFVVRTKSVPGVNEKMLILHRGEYYHVKHIGIHPDLPSRHYSIITATRRSANEGTVEFFENKMYMDYAQTFANLTGFDIAVSAGTLPNTAERTAEEIHQLLDVWRGPLHLTYGEAGDNGFTIDNVTNTITVNAKLRGENVLVRQYSTVSA